MPVCLQAVTLGALGLVAAVDIYDHRDKSKTVSPCRILCKNQQLCKWPIACLPGASLASCTLKSSFPAVDGPNGPAH